jgi:broad specificity phosphatase PhoE
MIRILVIRPGTTEYDEQGRIMGRLDIPLTEDGTAQVAQTVEEIAHLPVEVVYTAPSQSSLQTAEAIAKKTSAKVKRVGLFDNLDPGLWEGKLVDEVKNQQPKAYKCWEENPESVCPPEGEMVVDAKQRFRKGIQKTLGKHKTGVFALVVPEPMASVVCSVLKDDVLGNLWQAECSEGGQWELIDYDQARTKAG